MEITLYNKDYCYSTFNSYNNKSIEFIIYDKKYNFKNITYNTTRQIGNYLEKNNINSLKLEVNRKIKLNKKAYQKGETFIINGNLKNFPTSYKKYYNKKYGLSYYELSQDENMILFIPVNNINNCTVKIGEFETVIKKDHNNYTKKRIDKKGHKIYDLRDEIHKAYNEFELINLCNELKKVCNEKLILEKRLRSKN